MKTKIEYFPANNPNPVLSVAKDGTVLYSNEAGKPLLREWGARVGEKLSSSIRELVQRVISQNNPERMKIKVGIRVYLVDFRPIPEQKCVNIYGFDISDQKECEEKLLESERRLYEAKRLIYIGNWDWNIVANKMYRSDEMYHILGLDPHFDTSYGVFLRYIHPEDRINLDNALIDTLNGKPFNNNYRIVLPDGEERIVHIIGEVIFDEKNCPIRVRGIVQDITELRKSEEKIRKLADIVESSNDAIITKSLDGIITSWNKGAEQIYGYSDKEILGKPISILSPSHSNEETRNLTEMIKQGERVNHYETLRLRKDGKIINVSINLSPVFNVNGKLTAISIIARDITESKKAEEKLRESEEKHRNIVETANEGISIVDDAARVAYVNKKMENMLGCSSGEIIGKSMWDFICEESKPVVEKILENGWKSVNESYELELICKDSSNLWAHINSKSIFDEEGKFTGVLSMYTDITERKKAEEKLQESEEKYRNLIETANEGISMINDDGILTYVNQKMADMMGYAVEDIVGKTVWDFIDDDVKLVVASHFEKRHFITNDSFELRLRRKDGSPLWLILNSKSVFDNTGKFVFILNMHSDITERKKVEEKLRESEEKYRNLIETANEGISIIDNNGTVTYVNKKMADILGYAIEEIVSKTIWDFVEDEFKPIVTSNFEKRSFGISGSYELKLTRNDGSPLWVIVNVKPLFDKNGKFIGTLNLHTDINRRKEAEETLRNFEIARKKEIHHRIKNNLQVISSLLDLQADLFKGKKNITDSEVLEAFKESMDRVLSIALIHEELYRGKNIEVVNFSPYIKELANNLLLTYSLKTDFSINFDLEENIFFDMETAIPLGIIVNELVSNSLKHAFQGRDKGEIRIKLHREGNGESKSEEFSGTAYILSVSDDGIGIPKDLEIEDLDSLGLQLVTLLVDQLDGELEIKRDNGTEFTTRFKVTEKANQAQADLKFAGSSV